MKKKGKAPAFQFYVRDWLSDPAVQRCSASTRGIWINCLCFMWEEKERGILTGTVEKLTRLLNATPDEFQLFLEEAEEFGFVDVMPDVTLCNVYETQKYKKVTGDVTLKNRRMHRDFLKKENNRLRVKKHREKRTCNTPGNTEVTPPSSSSYSSTKSTPVPSNVLRTPKPPPEEEGFSEKFELKPEEPKVIKTYLDDVHPDALEIVSKLCGDLAEPWKKSPGEFKTPYAWVTAKSKLYRSNALAAALCETLEAVHRVRNFSHFANSRVFILNQNLNESDAIAEHERLKSEPGNMPESVRNALEKAAEAVKL